MKLSVLAPILDLHGAPINVTSDTGKDEPLILRAVIIQALTQNLTGDERLGGDEKYKLFRLAQRVETEDSPSLSADDIVTIKNRVGKGFMTLIVGRVFDLIDPTEESVSAPPGAA